MSGVKRSSPGQKKKKKIVSNVAANVNTDDYLAFFFAFLFFFYISTYLDLTIKYISSRAEISFRFLKYNTLHVKFILHDIYLLKNLHVKFVIPLFSSIAEILISRWQRLSFIDIKISRSAAYSFNNKSYGNKAHNR